MTDFEQDLQSQLAILQDMLLHERYLPQSPTRFRIKKKSGGERELAIISGGGPDPRTALSLASLYQAACSLHRKRLWRNFRYSHSPRTTICDLLILANAKVVV
jgi:hypothetical protein